MAAAKRITTKSAATSAYGESWRRLHPAAAAAERAMRKARADRERTYSKRDKLQDGGTPETRDKAARVHQGSLARLYTLGHITADQLAASQEIARAAERIGADVKIGTFSLETRVQGGRGPQTLHDETLGMVRTEMAYTRWRARPGAAIVTSMVLEDLSLTNAAKLLRKSKAGARGMISDLLDAWYQDKGAARREVDEADLIAMQAGLF